MANIYDMADTWNDAGTVFTAIKMNVTDTASDSASKLLDLQVGGSSKFAVAADGAVTVSDAAGTGVSFSCRRAIACRDLQLNHGFSESIRFAHATNNFSSALDCEASGVLAQRYSTTSQEFRIYNTYTDASNYERAKLQWSSNRLVLDTEEAGTGLARGITIGGTDLVLASLPTSDPVAAGQLWNDAGTLKVSAG